MVINRVGVDSTLLPIGWEWTPLPGAPGRRGSVASSGIRCARCAGGAHRAVRMRGIVRTGARTDDAVPSRPPHRCARGALRSRLTAPRCANGSDGACTGGPSVRAPRPRVHRTRAPPDRIGAYHSGADRTAHQFPVICRTIGGLSRLRSRGRVIKELGSTRPLGSGVPHHQERTAAVRRTAGRMVRAPTAPPHRPHRRTDRTDRTDRTAAPPHRRTDRTAAPTAPPHRPHRRTDRTDRTAAPPHRRTAAPTAPPHRPHRRTDRTAAPPHRRTAAPTAPPRRPHHRAGGAPHRTGCAPPHRSGLHSVNSTAPDGPDAVDSTRSTASGGADGSTAGEWTRSDPPSTAGCAPPCPPPLPPTSPPKMGSARGRRKLRPRALPRPVRLRPRPPAARRRRRRGCRRGTGGPGRPPACTRSGTRPRPRRCAPRPRSRGTTA